MKLHRIRSPLAHASRSTWGDPRRSLRSRSVSQTDAKSERRLANAALSPLASPLLPKGEASAFSTRHYVNAERLAEKGEDRAGSPIIWGEPEKHLSKSPLLRGATAVLGSPQVKQVAWI
jgi:hypothetical protein